MNAKKKAANGGRKNKAGKFPQATSGIFPDGFFLFPFTTLILPAIIPSLSGSARDAPGCTRSADSTGFCAAPSTHK